MLVGLIYHLKLPVKPNSHDLWSQSDITIKKYTYNLIHHLSFDCNDLTLSQ